MFFKKYGDIFVSIFFGLFSIVMIILANMLPKSKVMDIGPEFMPIIIGVLMLILSIILFVQSIKKFSSSYFPPKIYILRCYAFITSYSLEY